MPPCLELGVLHQPLLHEALAVSQARAWHQAQLQAPASKMIIIREIRIHLRSLILLVPLAQCQCQDQ